MIKFNNDWDEILNEEFVSEYYLTLRKFLAEEYKNKIIYPKADEIFKCFLLTPYNDVKIVILGQDPYHGQGQAEGLCFSVPAGIECPPSLINIFKELVEDFRKYENHSKFQIINDKTMKNSVSCHPAYGPTEVLHRMSETDLPDEQLSMCHPETDLQDGQLSMCHSEMDLPDAQLSMCHPEADLQDGQSKDLKLQTSFFDLTNQTESKSRPCNSFETNTNTSTESARNNNFEEMFAKRMKCGSLASWAKQGVLLLNTVLTVRQNTPLSHREKGWEKFTDNVIKKLNEREKPIIFILWGKNARDKKTLITNNQHFILEAPHPSPLSAYSGFFGCRHFSKANKILENLNETPIDWFRV